MFRVERSGLVAVRAIRAAQGICSESPVELQRLAAYGKCNSQRGCESAVFSRQSSVNLGAGFARNPIDATAKTPSGFLFW